MKTPIRTILIFVILLSLVAGSDGVAQWKKIATSLVQPVQLIPQSFGAIHYKDGVIWVGWKTLYRSVDLGANWTVCNSSFLNAKADIITDINFFDKTNGLLSTAAGGVFISADGGLSWKQIFNNPTGVLNVAFAGSLNTIYAITGDGFFAVSFNRGANWKTTRPGGDYGICFAEAIDKTIYVLTTGGNIFGEVGEISSSTDQGATWTILPGSPDGDSYTMCADSCDLSKLYLANEDHQSTVNDLSDLYYSRDSGKSWISTVGFPTPYLSGGMTCTKNVLYASSLGKGIYRSTDKGISWKSIGGVTMPNPRDKGMAFDARNIACADDNTVFLLDVEGSIWKTTNSGGDSLLKPPINTILSFTPDTLFQGDSIFTCDSVINKKIYITSFGCRIPKIISTIVNGADRSSFELLAVPSTLNGTDSVMLTFRPQSSGKLSADLIITLDDGRIIIIPVSGYGIPSIPLAINTQDQTADTLGGTVAIPIAVSGLQKPEDVTLVVHYDTVLNYNGSFSLANARLDIPGQQWKGRSKISISNLKTSGVSANAFFDVFNDSLRRQLVWFDSIDVITSVPPCRYATASLVTAFSTISALSGCGMQMLSRFIHYGEVPQFSIMPNPTGGDASITSSVNLGEANIQIIDMLGAERGASIVIFTKDSPVKIELQVPNGVYVLRINSGAGIYDLRIVVSR